MKTIPSMLLAGLLLVPVAAHAEFSYTYLEAGYERVEVDGISDNADGIGVRGRVAVADNIHLLGGFHSVEFDNVDFDTWDAGIGYNQAVGPNVDFVGSLSYVHADLSFNNQPFGRVKIDGDGYRADVGLRGAIAPAFELNGGLRHTDVDQGDETTVYVTGLFGSGHIRLLAEIEAGDDGEAYLLGGRFDF